MGLQSSDGIGTSMLDHGLKPNPILVNPKTLFASGLQQLYREGRASSLPQNPKSLNPKP